MTGTELFAIGHSAITQAHQLILLGGALGVLSILAGLASRRVGAPMLLVFLGLGMVAGEDGVLGIPYDDFRSAYLIGSVALAVILFEGGLKTPVSSLRLAFWPAAVLATIGVAITALIMGLFISLADGVPFLAALLAGAAAAPTDAAAVAVLLRRAGAALPDRLLALLEVESGLNDPMSVFLCFLVIHLIAEPGSLGFGDGALLFVKEMAGGALLGLGGGWALAQSLKRLRLEASLTPVLVLTGGLAVFGFAQLLGTSGFLAIYLAAVVTGSFPRIASTFVFALPNSEIISARKFGCVNHAAYAPPPSRTRTSAATRRHGVLMGINDAGVAARPQAAVDTTEVGPLRGFAISA